MSRQPDSPGTDPMLRAAGRFLELPFRWFAFGVELMAGAVDELGTLFETVPAAPVGGGRGNTEDHGVRPAPAPPAPAGEAPVGSAPAPPPAVESRKTRETRMAYNDKDTDLSGDDLKVVEYSIVTAKPNVDDEDRVLAAAQTITFSDDMRPEDFATWVVAKYFQQEGNKEIGHKDKKYLRVCYHVMCRIPLEKDDEVDVLRDIHKTMQSGVAVVNVSGSGSGGSGSGGSGSGSSGSGSSPADKAKKD